MANAPKPGKPAAAPKAAQPKPAAPSSPTNKPGAPGAFPHAAKAGAKPPAAKPEDEAGNETQQETAEQKPFWRSRKGLLVIAGTIIVIAAAGVEAWVYLRRPPPQPAVYDRARDPDILSGGAQAVDGATLTLGGRTIVLHGIRAPRVGAVCTAGSRELRCGEAARLELQKQIGTAGVECMRASDGPGGTIIALCRTEDGVDLAAAQVAAGWAVADMSRTTRYVPEQRRAEDSGSGLWRDDLARPEAWR